MRVGSLVGTEGRGAALAKATFFIAATSLTACGSDDPPASATRAPDAGTDARLENECADGSVARFEYPYAPSDLVMLGSGRTVYNDAAGWVVFLAPNIWRTHDFDDAGAELRGQIRSGPSLDRLEVIHEAPSLLMSGVDATHAYFGDFSIARIARQGGPVSALGGRSVVSRFLIDGDWIYLEDSLGIGRLPRQGGAIERVLPRSSPLMSLLAARAGTVYWSETDVDGLADTSIQGLLPGAAAAETLATLPPAFVISYPELADNGDLYFVASDSSKHPPTGSLRLLRSGSPVLETIDEEGLPPILLDGDALYYRLPRSGIVRRPRAGGPSTVVASMEPTRIDAAVIVGSDLYAFAASGCVYRVPK